MIQLLVNKNALINKHVIACKWIALQLPRRLESGSVYSEVNKNIQRLMKGTDFIGLKLVRSKECYDARMKSI